MLESFRGTADVLKDVFVPHVRPDADKLKYGTAGFRDLAEHLDPVVFRVGLIACVRSAVSNGIVGLCITASHNKAADNGVKIIDPSGHMLASDWEAHATSMVRSVSEIDAVKVAEDIIAAAAPPADKPSAVSPVSLPCPIVIIGRDTRGSGMRLAAHASAAIRAWGGVVVDIDVVTTPCVHWAVEFSNRAVTALARARVRLARRLAHAMGSSAVTVEQSSETLGGDHGGSGGGESNSTASPTSAAAWASVEEVAEVIVGAVREGFHPADPYASDEEEEVDIAADGGDARSGATAASVGEFGEPQSETAAGVLGDGVDARVVGGDTPPHPFRGQGPAEWMQLVAGGVADVTVEDGVIATECSGYGLWIRRHARELLQLSRSSRLPLGSGSRRASGSLGGGDHVLSGCSARRGSRGGGSRAASRSGSLSRDAHASGVVEDECGGVKEVSVLEAVGGDFAASGDVVSLSIERATPRRRGSAASGRSVERPRMSSGILSVGGMPRFSFGGSSRGRFSRRGSVAQGDEELYEDPIELTHFDVLDCANGVGAVGAADVFLSGRAPSFSSSAVHTHSHAHHNRSAGGSPAASQPPNTTPPNRSAILLTSANSAAPHLLYVNTDVNNSSTLNVGCGADYVKTTRHPPRLDATLSALAECGWGAAVRRGVEETEDDVAVDLRAGCGGGGDCSTPSSLSPRPSGGTFSAGGGVGDRPLADVLASLPNYLTVASFDGDADRLVMSRVMRGSGGVMKEFRRSFASLGAASAATDAGGRSAGVKASAGGEGGEGARLVGVMDGDRTALLFALYIQRLIQEAQVVKRGGGGADGGADGERNRRASGGHSGGGGMEEAYEVLSVPSGGGPSPQARTCGSLGASGAGVGAGGSATTGVPHASGTSATPAAPSARGTSNVSTSVGVTEKAKRECVRVVVVHTAYTNGAAVLRLKQAGVKTVCVPTGVKHLIQEGATHPVSVCFEANGHGTVLFSKAFAKAINAAHSALQPGWGSFEARSLHADGTPHLAGASAFSTASSAVHQLFALSRLLSQTVGDAIADLIATDAALSYLGLTAERAMKELYSENTAFLSVVPKPPTLPPLQLDERETSLVAPQKVKESIEALVGSLPAGTRVFVRPSGTEPVIRLLLEFPPSVEDAMMLRVKADEVKAQVTSILEEFREGS